MEQEKSVYVPPQFSTVESLIHRSRNHTAASIIGECFKAAYKGKRYLRIHSVIDRETHRELLAAELEVASDSSNSVVISW